MSMQPHADAFSPVQECRYEPHLLVSKEPAIEATLGAVWQPHPSPAFGFILSAPLGACLWFVAWILLRQTM